MRPPHHPIVRCAPLLAALGGLLLASPDAHARGADDKARRGRVTDVTAKRVYLDAGRADGLHKGDAVTIERGARRVGSCRVDALADHAATCAGDGVRPGDSFALPRETAAPRRAAEASPPPIIAEAEIARGRQDVAAAPYALVAWKRDVAAPLPLRASVADADLGHQAWVTFAGGGGRNFQAERANVSVRDAELPFGGLRASAELTALRYLQRPDNARYQPGTDTQVWVWEAALSARDPALRSLAFSAGRIRPFAAPGLAVLDGAQVGWMNADGTAEIGLLGGLSPDAVTLALASDRWLAGAYGAWTRAGRTTSFLRLVRTEARAGVRHDPAAGIVGEAEALAQLWFGRSLSLAGEAHMAAPTDGAKPATLEAGRFDLTARPASTLRFGGGFRYIGPAVAGGEALGGTTADPWAGTYHGDADATWEALPQLTIAAAGSMSRDVSTGSNRLYAGPDIGLPRVFAAGGLGFGYREEMGWLAGRSAWAQAYASPGNRLRTMVRVSWWQEQIAASAPTEYRNDLGLYANLDLRLARWLSLRANILARGSLEPVRGGGEGAAAGPSIGFTGGLDLVGRL